MKVIIFCGKAGVGKDTFGLELKRQLEEEGLRCIKISFADRVKDVCSRYFRWNGKKDEEGRKLLQFIGTDVFRNYDEDFWANEVVNLLKVCDKNDFFDYAIITDARFKNEISLLQKAVFDVMTFRVLRNNFVSKLSNETRNHVSETSLDTMIIPEITMSGDISKLGKEVEEFREEWMI